MGYITCTILPHDKPDQTFAPYSSLITGAATENDAEGFRIPAHEIETLVADTLERLLLSSTRLFDLLELDRYSPNHVQKVLARGRRVSGTLRRRSGNDAIAMFRRLLDRVTVGDGEVRNIVSAPGIRDVLGLVPTLGMEGTPSSDRVRYSIRVPARLKRCGGANRLIITDDDIEHEQEPDIALVKVLGRAHDWFTRLATGKAQSAADIARDEGLTKSYISRVVRLAFLAPDITEAILNGRQPPDLNAERLVRCSRLPLAWDDQRRVLGFNRQQQRRHR